MYKVIKAFADKQNNDKKYKIGSTYKGNRVDELIAKGFIEEKKEKEEKKEEDEK